MRYLKALLTSSWLLCPALAALLLLGSLTDDSRLRRFDLPFYDQLLTLRSTRVNPQVVLLTIDQQSRQLLGDSVTSRTNRARILQKLQQLGVHQLAMLEPLSFFDRPTDGTLVDQFRESVPVLAVEPLFSAKQTEQLVDGQLLPRPETSTDPKQLLAERLNPLAGFRSMWADMNFLPPAKHFQQALPPVGHLQFYPDLDGKIRRHSLFLPAGGKLLPSLTLQLVLQGQATKLKLPAAAHPGQLSFRTWQVKTDRDYQLLLDLSGRERPYLQYSITQLLTGELDDRKLNEKFVLFGDSERLGDRHPLATRGPVSVSELAAFATASLLADNPPHRPAWAWQLESLVLIYFLILLLLLVPRLSFRAGLITLTLFASTWLLVAAACLVVYGFWLQVFPALFLCTGGFFIVRWKVNSRNARHNLLDNHRQLAVTLQEQGRLDQALEKFLQFEPKDHSSKEMLYNLGLDFERKRMPHKAMTAYRHLLSSGRFRDAKQRIKQLQESEDSPPQVINPNATLVLDRPGEKPTLGRYRVEKELGQGAMGTVYLGVDPKINRRVAIKTLAYPMIEPDQLAGVKERFFREAEAAGRLSHPKIVTVYDVGEENDMAYMAMELLEGRELTYFCQPKQLLAPEQVVQVLKQIAQALDYAHQQGVVHRDIKPANIIVLEDGQIKVADFGVARVVSSSQTETGLILGTPSYMSPEQVAGKKVDGRSDLFSLGVVMYELLSGEKPFLGDSMAALMYNIANSKYRPLEELRPNLPEACTAVLGKLLQKTPSRRYKTAGILATELETLQQKLENG